MAAVVRQGEDMLELLTIAAILIGPIAAVQIEKRLEARRERTRRRTELFKTLMVYRASPLAHDHVAALNSIELVFDGRKYSGVRARWRALRSHYNDYPDPNQAHYQEDLAVWIAGRVNLTGELLQEMGTRLGFEFDEVDIRKGVYAPVGHADHELANNLIREGLARILTGTEQLNVRVVVDEAEQDQSRQFLAAALKVLGGAQSLSVNLERTDSSISDEANRAK